MSEKSSFDILFSVNVEHHTYEKPVSKKYPHLKLKYMQWSWVWWYLNKFDPNTTLKFKQFKEYDFQSHSLTGRDVDYCDTVNGCYVVAILTVKGRTQSQALPVMDYKNDAVKHPDMMQINKAKQRAFVKCAAMFGLGLRIYGMEDTLTHENYRNYRSNYSSRNSSYSSQRPVRSSGNSSSQPQNRQTTGASSKQIEFIQSLLSHKDGSSNPKLYKSFANHRNDMVEYLGTIAKQTGGTTKQIASYAIKHLSKLPDKQKKQKLDGNHAYTTA